MGLTAFNRARRRAAKLARKKAEEEAAKVKHKAASEAARNRSVDWVHAEDDAEDKSKSELL